MSMASPTLRLQHGAWSELEEFGNAETGAAEDGRDAHGNVEHRLELGGRAGDGLVFTVVTGAPAFGDMGFEVDARGFVGGGHVAAPLLDVTSAG
ncbi:MAG: hypothetical protein H6R00_1622 [Proteobacteria bacterium]|nr:hypothetical protein [Pseudomonadota bacterium]